MSASINASNSSGHGQPPPNPLAMLDFGFPGVAHAAMPQLLGWAINSYAPLMLVLGAFTATKSYLYQLLALLEKYFTSEVLVKPGSPSYDWVAAWILSKDLHKNARSTIARVRARGPNPESHVDGEEAPIWFAPWNDSFMFWFQGKILFYRTKTVTIYYREEEEISLKCLGMSASTVHKFLAACREEHSKQNQGKTMIFNHRGERWRTGVAKRARSLSNVILPEKKKKQLVDDLNRFTDPSTRAKYNSHNTAYRRGYLLHGPPGTGKTSLIMAIAGHWKRDLYVVSIPGLNDERLEELFAELPEKCIVLLEDIDAVGASRVNEQEHKEHQSSMSLSGLLNAIDGVATQEGRILIMTTNHVEKLDPALIREGRIDLRIELTYADLEMTRRSFEYMYTPGGEAELQSSEETLEIGRLAHEFASKVPEGKFTIAQIKSYIEQNWDSPITAVEKVEEWVRQTQQERETTGKDGDESKDNSNDHSNDHSNDSNSSHLVEPPAPVTSNAIEKSDLVWLWEGSDVNVRNDVPRTKNCQDLPAAACTTPPSSPCESRNDHENSLENPCMGSASPLLPNPMFGGPLASTLSKDWLSDGIEDSRTDFSDESSLFMVPVKRSRPKLSRTASDESCPGLAHSLLSAACTESSEGPDSENLVSCDCHGGEFRQKVDVWCCWHGNLRSSVGDLLATDGNKYGRRVVVKLYCRCTDQPKLMAGLMDRVE